MANEVVPRCAVSIRAGTFEDVPFIDALQKKHSNMVGFLQHAALEGKIRLGHVIIAENEVKEPVGYCIGHDQYFKRDDVGIISQLNVAPGARRKLVGATLIKAMFERSAYGCKLFCLWCAQDLQANHFWESLGFIPLAFRTGSCGKKGIRTHIFWQRRIRAEDASTPYWFPAKTDGGMMREDRIVLPIPPGVHWSDEMPILLPQEQRVLPEEKTAPRKRSAGTAKPQVGKPPAANGPVRLNGVSFQAPKPPKEEKPKAPRPMKQKVKANPEHIAKARELRDRYLEQFNAGLILPNAKYEVSRQIESKPSAVPVKMLAA